MGVDFIVVNLDQRQYFSPCVLGANSRQSSYMEGSWGQAVGLLVCCRDEINRKMGPLPGTWSGNRVIAVGDNGSTATPDDPHRSLFEAA